MNQGEKVRLFLLFYKPGCPLAALHDHSIPSKPEPERQTEQLEIRLDDRGAVMDHGQLREYDQRQDEAYRQRPQGRIEIALIKPQGLPLPQLSQPGEERPGQDAQEDPEKLQDKFKCHAPSLLHGQLRN